MLRQDTQVPKAPVSKVLWFWVFSDIEGLESKKQTKSNSQLFNISIELSLVKKGLNYKEQKITLFPMCLVMVKKKWIVAKLMQYTLKYKVYEY